jgi:hypothetical protein
MKQKIKPHPSPRGAWRQRRGAAIDQAGTLLNNATFRPFLVYFLVAIVYFCLCFPLSWYAKTPGRAGSMPLVSINDVRKSFTSVEEHAAPLHQRARNLPVGPHRAGRHGGRQRHRHSHAALVQSVPASNGWREHHAGPTVVANAARRRAGAGEGMPLMPVIHEMRFARDVGTKLVFMHGGRVHEEGPPKALFAGPKRRSWRNSSAA